MCEMRPWATKIVSIAHNRKAIDLHLLLNRAVLLKWQPEQIKNVLKIMCMKMEHMILLDCVSFHQCALRKLPDAFNLTVNKSWYPNYFNTEENLDSLCPIVDVT